MSKRKERKAQFLAPQSGAFTSLSSELITCARAELQLALHDRRRPVYRTRKNHYSSHAVGSILLVVTAFDAWLNESIWSLAFADKELMLLVDKPLDKKYCKIAKSIADVELSYQHDLNLIAELRHEIAHFLPRAITGEGNVPEWLWELHRLQLFLTSSRPEEVDFVFSQKIPSYRLAYWVWETIASAVSQLLDALGSKADTIRATGSNFSNYQDICSPSNLVQFDSYYKLELTVDTE